MKFDREGDVIQSLRNSIIEVDGKAFRVEGVDLLYDEDEGRERFVLLGRFCRTGEALHIPSDDPRVNHVPPRLGYYNHNGVANYAKRVPYRQWKRGLSERNVYPKQVLQDDIICKVVENDYPSFELSKRTVQEGLAKSVAFSRNFAIKKEGIMFKNILVTGPDFKLKEEHSYLKDMLEGAMS